VVLAALAGNLAIAVVKFVAFGATRSTAMLTEGIHSLVDTGDQLLLLVGQSRAAKAPNENHPFGYGMETYFWSFIVALMIFLAGGAVGVWEGVEKLLHPAPASRPIISFGVLAASAVFEGLSFRTAYREFRDVVRGRRVRLWGFLRLSKDPNVFATLLEDGAALTGLALAALGVAGASAGLPWADGAASVAIGVLLLSVAVFLANETRSLIAGEAAAPVIVACVEAALADGPGEVRRLRTLHLGPRSILVAVNWSPPDGLSSAQAAREMADLEARVRAADERVAHVFFEAPRPLAAAPPGVSPSPAPGRSRPR